MQVDLDKNTVIVRYFNIDPLELDNSNRQK